MTVTQATKGLTMLTDTAIATIQSALDRLAAIPSAQLASSSAATVPLLNLGIKVWYCAPREYTRFGARKISRKVAPAHYYAECDIKGLDVSATGATNAAALRNLFKALRNAATWNAPTLTVPLMLCEPTKAKAEARAERKAQREAAPTIIGPAPELRAVDSHDDSLQVQVGGYSRIVCNNLAPRFVEAPIIPAGAEAGTEGTFKALLGLRTEDKIVALVNALHAAGVTLHRVEEDGCPIIRAAMPDNHPNFGTITVLNL